MYMKRGLVTAPPLFSSARRTCLLASSSSLFHRTYSSGIILSRKDYSALPFFVASSKDPAVGGKVEAIKIDIDEKTGKTKRVSLWISFFYS